MDTRNDDRLARLVFGDDSITGSIRLILLILAFVSVFGGVFWILGVGH